MKCSHYVRHHSPTSQLKSSTVASGGEKEPAEERATTSREKRESGGDRQRQNETENWRRTRQTVIERMSDSFSDDLWMIYPWTCFCLSAHQRPLTSENTQSADRAEPWLISHYLKVDPQDTRTKSFPVNQSRLVFYYADVPQRCSYLVKGHSIFPLLVFQKKWSNHLQHRNLINCNLIHLDHCITELEEQYLTLKSTSAHPDSHMWLIFIAVCF